jgi:effector-binding domain-containing protein
MRTYEIATRMLTEQPAAAITATLGVAEIGPWLATVYTEVAQVLARSGAGPVGPPFARYHRLGEAASFVKDRFLVEGGFPAARLIPASGRVVPVVLPGGVAVWTVHVGPYEEMAGAYDALLGWARDQGWRDVGDPWEIYLSDPSSEPDPATWRTEVVVPVERVSVDGQ